MAVGISLGKPIKLSDGVYRIIVEYDSKLNPFPFNNVYFIDDLSHLVYIVLFNLLNKYDEAKGTGSDILELMTSAKTSINNPLILAFKLSDALRSLEERIIQSQKTQDIPDRQKLKQLEIYDLDVQPETSTVVVDLKILNQENTVVYINV
jgi:hypothetical protein